jgi:hypothetical protein
MFLSSAPLPRASWFQDPAVGSGKNMDGFLYMDGFLWRNLESELESNHIISFLLFGFMDAPIPSEARKCSLGAQAKEVVLYIAFLVISGVCLVFCLSGRL